MLMALLIVIGAILFSALSTKRETPKGTQKSYTVSYYKGMGEDAKVLRQTLEKAADAVSAVISQGPEKAMNKFNG